LIALPVTPCIIEVSDHEPQQQQQQQQQQQHQQHIASLFDNLTCIDRCPRIALTVPPPLPPLHFARTRPSPPGSSPAPPPPSKKQEPQAAPPSKRLHDAMHALCFESAAAAAAAIPALLDDAAGLPRRWDTYVWL
jgi:hypothetical protein